MDSVKIDEIHACLGAGEMAYYMDSNGEPQSAYMHMARKLDFVAKALGVAFDLAGQRISSRPSKHLDRGATIPEGWYFGQFGRNEGKQSDANAQQGGLEGEERLGLVYEVKGNRFRTSEASGEEEITQGGYILVESIPQLIHILMQDLDRSLGLQSLGSYAIANPNYNPEVNGFEEKYFKYNGLGRAFIDLLYLASDTNRHASQANIGSFKAQAIAQEVLGALGVPVNYKHVKSEMGENIASVVYPGFNGSGQTITDLLIWALMNVAVLNESVNK